ncbi:ABC transporter permease [Photobacterium japonica]|uniref:ABC transporter permease n=1 Tax=Photobacterium japonica TaxID=2910235 RepID=UPI003D108675
MSNFLIGARDQVGSIVAPFFEKHPMVASGLSRFSLMVFTFLCMSVIIFFVIDLPEGDFATAKIAELQSLGQTVDPKMIEILRETYGLDKPLLVRYWDWFSGILTGDLGMSLSTQEPVWDTIKTRLPVTLLLMSGVLIFMFATAIPIGIYSALRPYSVGDYVGTIIGFLGMATPNFVIAIIAILIGYEHFGVVITGLNSDEYLGQPMSLAKFWDSFQRSWVFILVLGTAGMATIIRKVRANLMEELNKPYVTTARAKGLSERELTMKYPVRLALIPVAATIGWKLPVLLGADIIVSQVMNMPTLGTLMLQALEKQDMVLAGDILLIMGGLTIIGTLVSDILLRLIDPRIRAGA